MHVRSTEKKFRGESLIKAIDVHVHVMTGERARDAGEERRQAAARTYFRTAQKHLSGDEVAELYRRHDMMAVIFDVDQETRTGVSISNDEVAEAVKRNPDTLIGFGSVDPWKGQAAVREIRRCVEELGLRGMKFHPTTQAFMPNDQRFYPIWEECSRLGVPIIFHTGMSGIGAGTPGGSGIRLRYSQPLLLDDVAADFPNLTIIGAHPSWPWQDEMLAIARHKSNVFIDLSGWGPKYFPASLVQHANSLLQDKCLFGTDFPLISIERWMQDFAELPIKEEARQKILRDNAVKLLKLTI